MNNKHQEALQRRWYDSLKAANQEKLKGRTFEEFGKSPIVQLLKTFFEGDYEDSVFQVVSRPMEEILVLIQEDQTR